MSVCLCDSQTLTYRKQSKQNATFSRPHHPYHHENTNTHTTNNFPKWLQPGMFTLSTIRHAQLGTRFVTALISLTTWRWRPARTGQTVIISEHDPIGARTLLLGVWPGSLQSVHACVLLRYRTTLIACVCVCRVPRVHGIGIARG